MLKVTLIKSVANERETIKKTVEALGLRKINSTKVFEDVPSVRGALKKVDYLVKVEEV
ncbi:MAG: 50S ribosomal protein L30 [Clostridia bacterium]|nr:50S ribosomal protein L30 [Clostridia bacterium]